MYADITDLPEDDLNDGVAPIAPTPTASAAGTFIEVCSKCRGSGTYGRVTSLGHSYCTQCKGSGKLAYKTSHADRIAKREAAKVRKERKLDAKVEAFEAEFPLIRDWWTGNDFGFAVSMREAVRKFGSLTDNQLAAVDRCVDSDLRRKQEQSARARTAAAAAPVVSVQPILDAFERAHGLGLKAPRMRAEGVQFSRAPDHGANAGAIYANGHGGVYLGKIAGGRFLRSRDCNDASAARVVEVCADPLTAVIAYGKKFGRCAICSRDLSDPVSVERGIGPDCYANMFG